MTFGEKGDVVVDLHGNTPRVTLQGDLAKLFAAHMAELVPLDEEPHDGGDVQDTSKSFDRYAGQLIARCAAVSVITEEATV